MSEIVSLEAGAIGKASAREIAAECHLRRGEQLTAARLYRQIAEDFPRTETAKSALYESGRLLFELGQDREALAVLDSYRERYPQHLFYGNASFKRCQLLVRLRRYDKARACLDDYRQRFAGELQAVEAILMSAQLAERDEDWQRAADLYGVFAVRTRDARGREKALYQRILCLHRGELPGLARAKTEYLQQYPKGRFAEQIRALP